MGYRLILENPDNKADMQIVNKMFGYLPEGEMKELASAQWLFTKENPKEDKEWWWLSFSYMDDHTNILTHEEFEEFMKLYAQDFNAHKIYTNTPDMDMAEYEHFFSLPNVCIFWG